MRINKVSYTNGIRGGSGLGWVDFLPNQYGWFDFTTQHNQALIDLG